MERLIYKADNDYIYWLVSDYIPYPKSKLIWLYMSFFEKNYWIMVESQGDQVILWDSFDEEEVSLEEISKLYLSKENYDQVIKEWNENAKNPAKYLVFARDDKGWVKLEPKSKLSEDDLQAIEEDKRAKVEYENRS